MTAPAPTSNAQRRLELALARDEIRAVLARYARGVDRADAALLKSRHHPDAIEAHVCNYTGNAHEYVDGAVPRIRQMGAMQHLLGSTHIDFDGEVAHVETYVWTFARFADGTRSLDTFTGGRLVDRFERRGGDWLIAHRRTVLTGIATRPRAKARCAGRSIPRSLGTHRTQVTRATSPTIAHERVLERGVDGESALSGHVVPVVPYARWAPRGRHAARRTGCGTRALRSEPAGTARRLGCTRPGSLLHRRACESWRSVGSPFISANSSALRTPSRNGCSIDIFPPVDRC